MKTKVTERTKTMRAIAERKKPEQPIVVRTDPEGEGDQPVPANYIILWVNIETLKPVPWNSERRITKSSLRGLMKRMTDEGFEAFRPILISKEGFIGDGHRRCMAAKYLGYKRVPVIFTDKTPEDLWAGNNGVKPLGARDWLRAAVIGGVDAPANTKNQIEQLRIILGDEGMQYLVDRNISPDIYNTTWKIGSYCKKTDTKFLRKSIYWLIKHKMANRVRQAIYVAYGDEPIDARILIQAIENDLPLKTTWIAE